MTRPHESPVGGSVDWWTPPGLFDRLALRFAIDVAAPRGGVPWVPADRHFDIDADGLAQPWYGTVWCNPPYGPKAPAFVGRMVRHGNGLLLIAARTETRTFQHAAEWAWSVCFLRERLHFIRPDGFQGRSAFASALFAFGRVADDALWAADLGWTTEGGNVGGLRAAA